MCEVKKHWYTNFKTGEEISSDLSLQDCHRILKTLPEGDRTDFTRSLTSKESWELSDNQKFWIVKLANQYLKEKTEREEEWKECPKLLPIHSMMVRAKESGLQYPKISLSLSSGNYTITLATPNNRKYPDAILIKRYRTLVGVLQPCGLFRLWEKKEDLIKALALLAVSPERVALLQASLTSKCCFCRQPINTRESVGVGYGPICADRYGLPWGDINPYKEKKAAIIESLKERE